MKKSKFRNNAWYKVDKKRLLILVIIVIVAIFSFNKKEQSLNRTAYKPDSKYSSGEITSLPRKNVVASPVPQSQEMPTTQVSPSSFHSALMQLSFTTPSAGYATSSMYRYHEGSNFQEITIDEPQPIDRQYTFVVANSPANIPTSWVTYVYGLADSINGNLTIDQFIAIAKKANIDTQYVKTGYLASAKVNYYLAYNKVCFKATATRMCRLQRMYLIPYEREISGLTYHTLALTTTVPLDGMYYVDHSEAELDGKIAEYWKSGFETTAFPPETQKIFNIQDQIINSLTFDNN